MHTEGNDSCNANLMQFFFSFVDYFINPQRRVIVGNLFVSLSDYLSVADLEAGGHLVLQRDTNLKEYNLSRFNLPPDVKDLM